MLLPRSSNLVKSSRRFGGSTIHELWHRKLAKLTPKPSLKLTASSKFVPENRPFFCPKRKPRSRIVSQPRISGANLYSVRVRCNFAIINFETMFHVVHAQNLYICFVEFSNAIKVGLRRAQMQGVILTFSSLEPEISSIKIIGRLTNLTEKLMIY